eukprot:scaffold6369_cov99-Cylindrotheca_fusiformis.AAC.1
MCPPRLNALIFSVPNTSSAVSITRSKNCNANLKSIHLANWDDRLLLSHHHQRSKHQLIIIIIVIIKMKFPLLLVAIAFAVPRASAKKECTCPLLNRPDYRELEVSARWIVHSLDWGVLSSISSRLDSNPPFGNVYSFVDGPCDESFGIPYFYASPMDQSLSDTEENNQVSFTLSEAAFPFTCGGHNFEECQISPEGGDPSNPMCARLTLTGKLEQLEKGGSEFQQVNGWLFHRHAAMKSWPDDHGWVIMKFKIEDIWFIDFFGGANVIKPEDYLNATLDFGDLMDMDTNEGSTNVGSDANGSSFVGYATLFIVVVLGSAIGNFIAATRQKVSNPSYQQVDKSDDVSNSGK